MIHPVLLSGGAGLRLWPLSRESFPKQYHALTGDRSLLQETVLRLAGDAGFAPPVLVANEEQRFLVAEQLRQIGMRPAAILLEPVGRSTAIAGAVAALYLARMDAGATIALLPTDHDIADPDSFRQALYRAAQAAATGALVALGITPTRAETGYGYIRRGAPLAGVDDCYRVDRFVEKPDAERAAAFLASGDYLWNGGVFVCRADRYLAELERFHADISAAAEAALATATEDLDFLRLGRAAYETSQSISVDYAVMERTDAAAVVPLTTGWSDVGSWASLWQREAEDPLATVTRGAVAARDVGRSYLRSEGPLLGVVGVDDLIVIAAEDAVLVAGRERAQEVRELVQQMKAAGRPEATAPRRTHRPWGWFEVLRVGHGYQIKHLMVRPGAALSLQRHRHRAEHWVVVGGAARITRGDEVQELSRDQSTYIPAGAVHRLENPGADELHVVEVQSGDYLGEDDIERLDDRYGRSHG